MKIIRLMLVMCAALATTSFSIAQTRPSNTMRAVRVIHFEANPTMSSQVVQRIATDVSRPPL